MLPSSRMVRVLPLLVFTAALLPGAGCGPGVVVTTRVGWRFADGRRCAESGAETVAVRAAKGTLPMCGADACSFPCADGEEPDSVPIDVVFPDLGGPRLDFAAATTQSAVLYRGALTPAPGGTSAQRATLTFTGGP